MTAGYSIFVMNAPEAKSDDIVAALQGAGASEFKSDPSETCADRYTFRLGQVIAGMLHNNRLDLDPVPNDGGPCYGCDFEVDLRVYLANDTPDFRHEAVRVATELARRYEVVLAYNDGEMEMARNAGPGHPLETTNDELGYLSEYWRSVNLPLVIDGRPVEAVWRPDE